MCASFKRKRWSVSQAGFTLMEVIVALVILSTSGLVLFAWINQNLQTATRLRESQARSQLQLEGISWLSTINPATEPEGQREMGGLRLTWRSALVEPIRNQDNLGGMLVSKWAIGLYRMTATITRVDGGLAVEWQQDVAGWTLAGAGKSNSVFPLSSQPGLAQ